MTAASSKWACWWGACALLVAVLAAAQPPGRSRVKRAQPPTFDPAKAREYFFEDVFSQLIGERPASAAAAATPAARPTGGTPAAGIPPPGEGGGEAGGGWAEWVSASTLEDEVKSIKQDVDKTITTPSDFAGRGHKVIRREFSVLAMLFSVIGEYDGEVRFKREAPVARALFARTARNAKAGGNLNVYNEAKLRKADLEDLVNGSSLSATGVETPGEWGAVVDRSPLMQRLEQAFQHRLVPAVASQDEFARNGSRVLHEAEMIAVMARVLAQPGMDDADDESYANLAGTMQFAAAEIVAAVKRKDYDQARSAAGKIDKACSQCHESYR